MIASSRVDVNAAGQPELIASNEARKTERDDFATQRVLLKNATGTAPVYLGQADVTAANGFEWSPADGPLEIELEPGEAVYGVVAATTQTVHVLKQGR